MWHQKSCEQLLHAAQLQAYCQDCLSEMCCGVQVAGAGARGSPGWAEGAVLARLMVGAVSVCSACTQAGLNGAVFVSRCAVIALAGELVLSTVELVLGTT